MHQGNRVNNSDGLVYSTLDLRGAIGPAGPRGERMGVGPTPERDPTIRESLTDVLRLLRQARQSLGGLDYKVLGISCVEKGEVATQSNPQDEPLVAIVQQLSEPASAVAGVADALNKKL